MIVVRLAVRMTFREKIRLGWGKINRMVVFSLSDCTRDNLVRSKDVARGGSSLSSDVELCTSVHILERLSKKSKGAVGHA